MGGSQGLAQLGVEVRRPPAEPPKWELADYMADRRPPDQVPPRGHKRGARRSPTTVSQPSITITSEGPAKAAPGTVTWETLIAELMEHHSEPLVNFSEHPRYSQFLKLAGKLRPIDPQYQQVKVILSSHYKPTNIRPDTVAAFFFGCNKPNYGKVSSACSPYCVGQFGRAADCEYQVWTYTGNPPFLKNTFINSNSNSCYLYVNDDFVRLPAAEKETLKNNGVSQIKIMLAHDPNHAVKVQLTSLADYSRGDPASSAPAGVTTQPAGWNPLWLAGGGVAVLLLIGIVGGSVWYYRRRNINRQ